MKAVHIINYGGVDNLSVINVPTPIYKDDEVLIRNRASSINFNNHSHLTGKPFVIRFLTGIGSSPKIKIPGSDVSGVVVSIGKKVTGFKVGDEVIGDLSDYGMGAFAEYVAVKEKAIISKPKRISFLEASCLPLAASVAFTAVEKAKIKQGMEVLIVGGTGGVGSFAVQIAKNMGAIVTAVCSTKNVEYVKKLGADKVIDYKTEDFTKTGNKFDVILAIGGYRSIWDYKKVLKKNGIYLLVGGNMKQFYEAFTVGLFLNLFNTQKFNTMLYITNKNTLNKVKEMAEQNKIVPKVDKVFKLENIKEAFSFYQTANLQGKVVVEI